MSRFDPGLRGWFANVWPVLLAFFVASLIVVGALKTAHQITSTPVFVPHIASDCRAACTLEGMELAGVELGAPDGRATCLCAPVSR